VKQGNVSPHGMRASWTGLLILLGSAFGWSQESSPAVASSYGDSTAAAIHELQQQVKELRSAVAEMRSEAEQYRAENAQLRHELQAARGSSAATVVPPPADSYGLAPSGNADPAPSQSAPPKAKQTASLEDRVASLEESTQLANSKIDDQYQTKLESASKYRVRLSGIVLLNLFNSHGNTNNQDIPNFVMGPSTGTGNFGATMRQSEIGLEVFGPALAGAKTSGSVQADFAGGFPATWNGVNSGIFRLRTASMRMDWKDTSVVVGQDNSFFSPLSPTSFASLAVPALTYAGNLWAWTPQLRIEHRFAISSDQNILIQGGIMDNLTGEFPAPSYFRAPGPGELSRQPAYAIRTSWTRTVWRQPLSFGVAGYYSRQNWLVNNIDGWAGMADWQIPLSPRVLFTGEFFRGRAIGGIGGGISQSVVYEGNPMFAYTPVRGLDTIGGWSQLKFKATNTLEFNVAAGVDNPTAAEVRAAGNPILVQNRGGLVNFVFRPRSSLLFSAEYGHLRSFEVNDVSNSADQYNLMMGILF
jgi:cell division septum initiation protein DivIVA